MPETGSAGPAGSGRRPSGAGGGSAGAGRPSGPGDGGPAQAAQASEAGDAEALKAEAAGRSPIRSGLHGRLDAVRATRAGRLTLKIVIGTLGGVLVVAGLVMVPFPGPGWAVVFAGLAVLALEFHWAHRLLEFGKRTLAAWMVWLGRQNVAVKGLVILAAAATATAIVYFGVKLSFGVDLVLEAQKLLIR
ncbi:TIGR02611 family protein [Planomonospora sp. ID82291]|uniref:TIGR02611 family protein n=1 Tax=Planomonospora sp. ID82291 TaxID=2738136 RepID=UPI001A31B738|nr:TIGR02611 family protein [Planomonospora sp. ID82291]MBG0816141.1 TIGR02611 family protein [Planomonospora sp. ID82291]